MDSALDTAELEHLRTARNGVTMFLDLAKKKLPDKNAQIVLLQKEAETVLNVRSGQIPTQNEKDVFEFDLAKLGLEKFLLHVKDQMSVEKVAEFMSLLLKLEDTIKDAMETNPMEKVTAKQQSTVKKCDE